MFKGEDTTQTLAKILEGEPDWSSLPQDTPPTIHLLLRKCLAKDRKRRLQHIDDARVDLEQAIADPSSSFIRLSDEALQETKGDTGIQRPVFVGALLGVAVVAVAVGWFLKPTPPPPPIRHLIVDLEFQGRFSGSGVSARLSPDGSKLAFIGIADEGTGQQQLFIKPLNERREAFPLTAADGVSQFSFSPDSKEIVFRVSADSKLQRVNVSDGRTARPIGDFGTTTGIHWAQNDSIVFGLYQSTNGIMRISSNGDAPESYRVTIKSRVQADWKCRRGPGPAKRHGSPAPLSPRHETDHARRRGEHVSRLTMPSPRVGAQAPVVVTPTKRLLRYRHPPARLARPATMSAYLRAAA